MADAKTNINLHILEPRATEKTYLEQTKRTYVFIVKRSTSKQEVAKMVEKEFNVKVTDVRTMIRDGKKTKFSKGKHAYPGITHRQDRKFAYVTLAEGNSIRVFDEPEKEDNKTSATEAKKAEKAAKKADSKNSRSAAKADKNAGKENK